jgi:ABC-type Mn2+/Zn2+ transport system ATPase subunit
MALGQFRSLDLLHDITLNGMKVTIAVIGGNGCGKSTAVSKGLKAYRLADPMTTTDSPEDDALFQCAYAGFSS